MQIKVDMSKNTGATDVNSIISQVLEVYLAKLSEDSPEAFEQLAGGEVVTGLTVDIGFKVAGQSELQVLSVDPHGTEHQEMLVVTAETDEQGELIWDKVTDNDEVSLFSDIEVMIAEGVPTDFTAIESNYYSDQLEEVGAVNLKEYEVEVYINLDSAEDTVVVWYSADNKLISEVEITLKDGQTAEDVLAHYQQLK